MAWAAWTLPRWRLVCRVGRGELIIPFQNLKIRFSIGTEMVVPRSPIPFDSLLMKATALSIGCSLDEEAGMGGLRELPELPIERHPTAAELYMASVGFTTASGRHVQFYTKQYYGDIPEHLDTSGGFYKSYRNILYTLSPPITVSFFVRGDKSSIEALLRFIPALGPKRSQGYGKVKEWSITEIAEDRSWIFENQPMRAIPIRYYPEKLNEWYYMQANPVPPSYAANLGELCYFPRPDRWYMVML